MIYFWMNLRMNLFVCVLKIVCLRWLLFFWMEMMMRWLVVLICFVIFLRWKRRRMKILICWVGLMKVSFGWMIWFGCIWCRWVKFYCWCDNKRLCLLNGLKICDVSFVWSFWNVMWWFKWFIRCCVVFIWVNCFLIVLFRFWW